MKKLELANLEKVQGGSCSDIHEKSLALIGLGATLIGATGGIAAIIVAPTGIGVAVAGVYCAFA